MAIADFAAGMGAVKQQLWQRQMAEMEAQREAAAQAQRSRQFDEGLRFDRERFDFDREQANRPGPEPAPMVVGGRLVTRTGEVLYDPPKEPKEPRGPISLSPGSQLVDPETGRLITSAPRAPETPKAVNKMWVIRGGKPAYVAEDQVQPGDLPGNTREQGRPSLGAEKNALNFFNRMLEAERNARAVEDKVTGADVLASEHAPAWLENWIKTPEGQAYTQAQRTFTEARLRKESGAAIPQGEYDTDRRTNFRVPGDTDMRQKRQSRLTTMRGIGQTAGRALQEHYGEDATLDAILKEFEAQEAASAGGAPATQPIRQRNARTGQVRISHDGGKTWQLQ